MWRRSWIALAGCIATSLSLPGAAPDFHAGAGSAAGVKALVLRDRQANVLVIADAAFPVTPSLADLIAAQLLQTFEVERPGILLYSSGSGKPAPHEVVEAVTKAAMQLEPATVQYDGKRVSVAGSGGRCFASFPPLESGNCTPGNSVRPPIRAAYQVIEPPKRLETRDGTPAELRGIQAIAIGKQVTIVSIGGGPPVLGLPTDADARTAESLRRMLVRIGR